MAETKMEEVVSALSKDDSSAVEVGVGGIGGGGGRNRRNRPDGIGVDGLGGGGGVGVCCSLVTWTGSGSLAGLTVTTLICRFGVSATGAIGRGGIRPRSTARGGEGRGGG